MTNDPRHITNGHEIPTVSYSDQPYIVKTDDGAWLCCVTTGTGEEGEPGQSVTTMRSTDKGKTWSDPVYIEPIGGPENSFAVLLKVNSGRIYIFYNHNTDDMRKVIADDPPYEGGYCTRMDSLGYFVFKYSDDHGKSWSKDRYVIPVREFEIDRNNAYEGKVRFFWNVGRPFTYDGAGFVSLHKVGGFGKGFFTSNEGVLLKSGNILTEADPAKIEWETLPDGDIGLRTPPGGGPVAGEHSYSVLSDGSFYSVYRTVDGYPCETYSRDGGHTWETPKYKEYADGRKMKHPRAANFAWKCENGKYIYWFHNHGGHFIAEMDSPDGMLPYEDRNPVWVSGGVEADGPNGKVIKWSQPEVLIYDDDTRIRMSYPDLVEEDGEYYVTETQKDIARVHKIDKKLLNGLWDQLEGAPAPSDEGVILEVNDSKAGQVKMPELPFFTTRDFSRADYGTKDLRQSFTFELWVKFDSLEKDQVLFDNRNEQGKGFALQTTGRGTVELIMHDGRGECRWDCDGEILQRGKQHHIVAVVDGGPKIISFVVDGKFCDGAELRQFGWGRYNPNFFDLNGEEQLKIAPNFKGEIKKLRIYERVLRTAEAIGNFRAGL